MRLLSNKMRQSLHKVLGLGLLMVFALPSQAAIDGVTGTNFNLTAKSAYITTPDGDSLLVWGYALPGKPMQYPGPTLIVNQGDTVTVTLKTNLLDKSSVPVPVSIIFPGQEGVTATGGAAGALTQESTGSTDTVTYSFNASHAGTYMYQSGTNQQLQTEMGLIGALIVRPSTPMQAYNHPDTAYDYEYLFVITEMDAKVHYAVDQGVPFDNTTYQPVLWFINGRNAPDTMADSSVVGEGILPHQPYNSLPRVHPGDVSLNRFVIASRDMHPFHTHGNHIRIIARNGRLLESAPGNGPDISHEDFTVQSVPGETYDGLWNWTGEQLGWDIFGSGADYPHGCDKSVANSDFSIGADGEVVSGGDVFDSTTHEYCPDHDKPLPVAQTQLQDLTFGGFFSGSPFLGAFGDLPPGEGGLNLEGGIFFMWHSHNEKEIINNDIFPGGMMTMMIVEPPGVAID